MAVTPDANMPEQGSEPVLHGLLQSARVLTPGEDGVPERWEGGFGIWTGSCDGAKAWDPCTPHDNIRYDRQKDSQTDEPDYEPYQPFVAYTTVTCSSFGFEGANYVERAKSMLTDFQSSAIEREFWTGEAIDANPHLISTPFDDDHIVNPGGAGNATIPVSPREALILLTQAIAECYGDVRGMIHASPGLVTAWLDMGAVAHDDDGRLVSVVRGDFIVAGSGYDRTVGPHGAPLVTGQQEWAFATGMVYVLVGDDIEVYPETLAEALDRQTNTVEFRAERTAAVWHDGCCQFAVLVDTASGQVCCPPVEGVNLDGFLEANWIEDGSGLGIPGPWLVIAPTGAIGNDFAPPLGNATFTQQFSWDTGGVVGAPTVADEPGEWLSAPNSGGPGMGVIVPLGFVEFFPEWRGFGVPLWFRTTAMASDTECVYEIIYFFPEGFPEAGYSADVPFYAKWDSQSTIIENCDAYNLYTIQGGTEDPITDEIFVCPWSCPPPVCATPVMIPECFQPIAVTLDASAPVDLEARVTHLLDGDPPRDFSGFRSLTVTVLTGTANVDSGIGSVSLPAGTSLTWGVDFANDVMSTTMTVEPVDGTTIVSWTQVAV